MKTPEEDNKAVLDGLVAPPELPPQSREQLKALALISYRRPWWFRLWSWVKRKVRG